MLAGTCWPLFREVLSLSRQRKGWLGLAAFALYVATIYGANALTKRYGFLPVFWFGLSATAGTYAAGLAFVARNLVQETLGRRLVLVAIVAGAALSWVLTSHSLALASGTAFLLSETADFLVYTPIRGKARSSRGWAFAAVGGNVAGTIVDTFVFLSIAGFPLWANVPGQLLGKAYATGVYLGIGWAVQRTLRGRDENPLIVTNP